MARVLMLFALCVIPALVSTSCPIKNPFVFMCKVYCDTCRCGFETSATTYIPGAKVRVQCKDRDSLRVVYNVDGVTDATWAYKITIPDDQEDEICETVLISIWCSSVSHKMTARSRAQGVMGLERRVWAKDR